MRQQRGFSIFGLVFLLAILGFLTMIAIRVVPNYLDFLTISEATRNILNQPRIALERNDEIMKKISTSLSINNINLEDLGDNAITLSRDEGRVSAEIDYYIEEPMYGNDEFQVAISMHFAKSHEGTGN